MTSDINHTIRLRELFGKYYAASITAEEMDELSSLVECLDDQSVLALLKEVWNEEQGGETFSEQQSERVFTSIIQSASKSAPVITRNAENRPVRIWKRIGIAVAFAGCIATGYWAGITSRQPIATFGETIVADLPPGSEGAVLTFSDGRQIILDTTAHGIIASRNGMNITKEEGRVRYEGDARKTETNTMSTPRGKMYRLVLSDGSKVWLNASSSITFPTAFTGNERMVSISGEVYFEIAKNASKPFRVRLYDGSTVEVLGTNFNVNSYVEDGLIRTTLLEGSVMVSKNAEKMRLEPGQQCRIGHSSLELNRNPDLDEVVSWKNGFFSFRNSELKTILRQLSRWYDVDIVYDESIPDVYYSGEIDRSLTLNQIFSLLEKTRITHKIEGNKLTIMRNI